MPKRGKYRMEKQRNRLSHSALLSWIAAFTAIRTIISRFCIYLNSGVGDGSLCGVGGRASPNPFIPNPGVDGSNMSGFISLYALKDIFVGWGEIKERPDTAWFFGKGHTKMVPQMTNLDRHINFVKGSSSVPYYRVCKTILNKRLLVLLPTGVRKCAAWSEESESTGLVGQVMGESGMVSKEELDGVDWIKVRMVDGRGVGDVIDEDGVVRKKSSLSKRKNRIVVMGIRIMMMVASI
ncbi:hypothetical protein SERLA73DRAFT_152236 [Serpula lacrymans var. lacrymans S7.3]|uniref:Uncharacterized protein n=1 Tax=Serpula lacrymans var. lacrymans (strain S7.3) TaxID=936435 RepID=F8PVD8_SERL3|nr:hypothetical protein SERLA73DRAFT_152236 [Serpula lacrymans var. lacrymans S7.3]